MREPMMIYRAMRLSIVRSASAPPEPPQKRELVLSMPAQEPPVINVEIPPIEVNVTLDVPEQPAPVVTVNIEDEPIDATVNFKRRPDGSIDSATISENDPEG